MSSKSAKSIFQVKFADDVSAEAIEILATVGSAISAWTQVEQYLFALFRQTAYPKSIPLGASSSFFASHSIGNKLSVVNELLSQTFRDPSNTNMLKDWRSLRNRIKKLSSKRDELAHGAICNIDKKYHPKIHVAWVPFFHATGFLWAAKDPKSGGIEAHFKLLTVPEIEGNRDRFNDLAGELSAFIHQHRAILTQPPSFLVLEGKEISGKGSDI